MNVSPSIRQIRYHYLFQFAGFNSCIISMASSSGSYAIPSAFLSNSRSTARSLTHFSRHIAPLPESGRNFALLLKWKTTKKRNTSFVVFSKKRQESALQYRKLGDSDLEISEITLGTVSALDFEFIVDLYLK